MADPVTYELSQDVAKISLDDGRANALSHASIDSLHGFLDRAEQEAGSVLIVGRPGRFCGGFDLATMKDGSVDDIRALVKDGGELFLRLFGFPKPVITACSGHAVAAGAIILLSSDLRIGVAGDFKIGLSEVGIGMALPIYGFELARERLSKRHLLRATTQAELYTPDAAVDAGFLDRTAAPDDFLTLAGAEAERLAQIPQPAFRTTKTALHARAIAHMRDTLDEDMKRLTGGPKL